MHTLVKISAKTSETEDTLATQCCQREISQYFNLLPDNPRTIIVSHYFEGPEAVFFPFEAVTSGNSKSLLLIGVEN